MTQNRSSAVMQQRIEPHHSLDDFPTPPWATRALCEWLQNDFDDILHQNDNPIAPTTGHLICREPAANRGHMVKPLREYFKHVEASDVHDYGAGFPVQDYLFTITDCIFGEVKQTTDWTITNPPFRLAQSFIHYALETSKHGVAMIVRTAFLEGVGRYKGLFTKSPPTDILQFTERVVMHRGKLSAKGSTATAYCWLVWRKDAENEPTRFHWIPPCRKRLERAEDYA